MPQDTHPYRSVLYMPGSRPRALEKARVAAGRRADPRPRGRGGAGGEAAGAGELVAEAVEAGGYGGRKLLVRVNGLDTDWGEADLAARLRGRPGRDPAAQGRDPGRRRTAPPTCWQRHGAPERMRHLGDDGDAARRS